MLLPFFASAPQAEGSTPHATARPPRRTPPSARFGPTRSRSHPGWTPSPLPRWRRGTRAWRRDPTKPQNDVLAGIGPLWLLCFERSQKRTYVKQKGVRQFEKLASKIGKLIQHGVVLGPSRAFVVPARAHDFFTTHTHMHTRTSLRLSSVDHRKKIYRC